MPVTLNDIAKHVGVTKTTVSWVLNNQHAKNHISERTCNRVRQVAKDLGYRPSFAAKSLAEGKTASFGLICSGLEHPFFAELAASALQQAKQRDHHLLLAATQWDSQSHLDAFEMLLDRGVDGIMMFSNEFTSQTTQYHYIHRHQFPVVSLWHQNGDLPRVGSDFLPGIMQAVEHLKKRGCRSIGFVGDLPNNPGKTDGFQKACQHYGMETSQWPCELILEPMVAIGRKFARHSNRPDAVIATSDETAMMFMQGLFKEGVSVPDDVAVIGFDDIQMGQMMNPQLTTIAQDHHSIVIQALDWLVEMSQKKQLLSVPPRLFPTRLVVRESA